MVAAVIIMVLMNVKTGRSLMLGLIVALLLVIAVGGVILLNRSRSLTLTIDTPPGHSYVGRVMADGREYSIRGDTDQELTFPGTVFNYVVILERPDGVQVIEVSDGFGRDSSTLGVDGNASRSITLNSTTMGGMLPQEWDWAAKELMPEHANETAPESDAATPDVVPLTDPGEGTSPEETAAETAAEPAPPGST
jgi:hypothetical protein